jgi:hypothetical protein
VNLNQSIEFRKLPHRAREGREKILQTASAERKVHSTRERISKLSLGLMLIMKASHK